MKMKDWLQVLMYFMYLGKKGNYEYSVELVEFGLS
jgi:hypothetical protein